MVISIGIPIRLDRRHDLLLANTQVIHFIPAVEGLTNHSLTHLAARNHVRSVLVVPLDRTGDLVLSLDIQRVVIDDLTVNSRHWNLSKV